MHQRNRMFAQGWPITVLLLGVLLLTTVASAQEAFTLNIPDRLSYTTKVSMSLEVSVAGTAQRYFLNCMTKNVLEKQANGGFLLTLNVQELQSHLSGNTPLPGLPPPVIRDDVFKGMTAVLELDEQGKVKGYQEGKSPSDWIKASVKRPQHPSLTDNKFIDQIFSNLYVPIRPTLNGRPTKPGSRWFDIDQHGFPEGGFFMGGIQPCYGAVTVKKRQTVAGRNCLVLIMNAHSSIKGLAKMARCKEKDITNALTVLTQPPAAASNTQVSGQATTIVDPATLQCFGTGGTITVTQTLDIPPAERKSIPKSQLTKDGQLLVKCVGQIAVTYDYDR